MNEYIDEKRGMGCFAKGCLTVIVFIALAIFGVYFAVFHTALPANLVKKGIMKADQKVDIGTIKGSLNSGFSVDRFAYSHTNGNVSSAQDVAIRFKRIRHGVIIETIEVKNAHLYADWSNPANVEGEFHASSSGSNKSTGPDVQTAKTDLGRYEFAINKIDINDVRIEDPNDGAVLQLDAIHLSGFRTTHEESRIGEALIKSQNVTFSLKPTGELDDDKRGTAFTFEGQILAGLHSNVLRDITFSGAVDMTRKEEPFTRLSALDGAISLQPLKDGMQRLVFTDVTPADFVQTDFPIRNIELDLVDKPGDDSVPTINKAAFTIGGTRFEATEFLPPGDGENEKPTLVATATSPNATYRCLACEDEKVLEISSEPEMSLSDILANLVHTMPYGDLTTEQKKSIDEAAKHFRLPEDEDTPQPPAPETDEL